MSKTKHYFIINKPYKILSQFTDEGENKGLLHLYPHLPKDVYPVGRLDLDSEGLLILTNDKSLNNKLLNPSFKHSRTYWVEVDGIPDRKAMDQLMKGVDIKIKGKSYLTKPAKAHKVDVDVEERNPPVNYKKHPERTWLEIILVEGKNRQVRRMTAKVGHPTLRLIRVAIEDLRLASLKPGEITRISEKSLKKKLHLLAD